MLVFGLLLTWFSPVNPGQANYPAAEGDPQVKAQTIIKGLTPEERVGQLFLVTFKNRSADQNSQIYDLITNYHVGGVVLNASNDNFTGPDQTIQEAYRLISEIQTTEWNAIRNSTTDLANGKSRAVNYVPMFVGIQQDGDGSPSDQILYGLTQMPDEMAIGATWKTETAFRVGQVAGQELQALGFNLFLGPMLDVSETQNQGGNADLGVRSFGGSPYWVGEMGKAYIAGMHAGSQNKITVVAGNFPGSGSSDRNALEEVPTVRESLDQLKQTDFAPFFAVTGNSPTVEASVDGLLVTHIRYTGLQGNIRPITRPVSLDPAAIAQLMSLPAFSSWRDRGGLLISDDLGSQAIRRIYDPSMKTFDARQVARDAFLAGNDLMYADNFVASGDPDMYTTIVRTLQFFTQKYREDATFAQRVDAAVTRILAAKLRIYPDFDLGSVLAQQDNLVNIGTSESQQVANDVANQAVTLISPQASEIDTVIAQPPARTEKMVFFTDTQTTRQCSQCLDLAAMPVDGLQNAVLKLYGPQASGQVISTLLSSYSFSDLNNYLNGFEGYQGLEDDLRTSNWVVFSILNTSQNRPSSGALQRLLAERPDLLSKDQKVIVFAFNAPYYLDATDIAKVTAYYGVYSKVPTFLDASARLLFREMTPGGQLPVSVPGVGYDLNQAVSPDPKQVIPLDIDLQPGLLPTIFPPPVPSTTPEPPLSPTFNIGDTIPLRTGVIRDHNQNPVPDGTTVHFILIRNGDATTVQQIDASTLQGVARAAFRIERDGLMEIRVTSGEAQASEILRLSILQGVSAGVTALAPPPTPTETLSPSPTPTQTTTPSVTPTALLVTRPHFDDWLLAMFMIALSVVGIYFIGVWWGSMRWGVRWALCAVIGGLAAYSYMAIGLPGSTGWIGDSGRGGIMGMTFLGVLLGWAAGVGWRFWLQQKATHQVHR